MADNEHDEGGAQAPADGAQANETGALGGEAGDAFDAMSDEQDKGTGKPAASDKTDDDADGEPAAKTSKSSKKADAKAKPDESKPAAAAESTADESPAAKRLAEMAGTPAAAGGKAPTTTVSGDDADKDKQQARAAAEAVGAKSTEVTDYDGEVQKILDGAALGQKRIKIKDADGKESTLILADFAKEYPDIATTTAAIGQHIAKAQMEDAINKGLLVDAEKFNAVRASMMATQWKQEVELEHPGGIAKAKSADFKAWVGTLPEAQQKLYDRSTPEQAVAMLAAFDEFKAAVKSKSDTEGEKARKQKKAVDSLHGGSLSGSSPREVGAGKPDDYDDAFDKEADAKD